MARIIIEIIVMTLLVIVLPVFFLPGAGAPVALFTLLIAYLAFAAPQIAALAYALSRRGRPLAEAGLKIPDRRTWGWMGAALGGAFGVLALYSLVLWAIMGREAGTILSGRPFLAPLSPATVILLGLFCAAVGYREEMFFRAYLVTRLGDLGVAPGWAVAGSSLVFGLAHVYEGPFGIAVAAASGALFGVVFIRSRDLHAVAGAHALYNLGVWLLGYALSGPTVRP